VMEGTIAYYGTYTVDEMGKTISLRVEASTLPNQVGSEQANDHFSHGQRAEAGQPYRLDWWPYRVRHEASLNSRH
jgi:hypothetical protein